MCKQMTYLAFASDIVLPVAPMHNTAHAVPVHIDIAQAINSI